MGKLCPTILAILVLTFTPLLRAENRDSSGPKTVKVHNGSVTLHALLWRPLGRGPFPAVLLNHGSGRTREELKRLGPYEKQAYVLGRYSFATGMYFCICSVVAWGSRRTKAPPLWSC